MARQQEEDDLEAELQAELQALRDALGVSYQTLDGGVGEELLTVGQPDRFDGQVDLASSAKRKRRRKPAGSKKKKEPSASPEPAAPADKEEPAAVLTPEGEVEVIQRALEENTRLQECMRAVLTSIDKAINRTATLQAAVDKLRLKGNRAKSIPASTAGPSGGSGGGGGAAGASAFWVAPDGRSVPPPNRDAQRLAAVYRYLPHSFPSRPWTLQDRQKLQQGVLQAVQEAKFSAQLEEMQARLAAGAEVDADEVAAASEQLRSLDPRSPEVVEAAKTLSGEEWGKVARCCLPQRSAVDCRLQWANLLAANQQPWEPAEEQQLLRFAEKHHSRQWERVAAELGTGRSAAGCLGAWQRLQARRQDKDATSGAWSAEQDEALRAVVGRLGRSWRAVAQELGASRTPGQVRFRWAQLGGDAQERRTGRWDAEEDQALLQAVAFGGKRWAAVARQVPGRNDVQCRERYCNVLDPDLNPDPWSAEEDKKLQEVMAAQQAAGKKVAWGAIAAQMPGRTDNGCKRRINQLRAGLPPGGIGFRPGRKAAAAAPRGRRGRSRGRGRSSRGGGRPQKRRRAAAESDSDGEEEAMDEEPLESGSEADEEAAAALALGRPETILVASAKARGMRARGQTTASRQKHANPASAVQPTGARGSRSFHARAAPSGAASPSRRGRRATGATDGVGAILLEEASVHHAKHPAAKAAVPARVSARERRTRKH